MITRVIYRFKLFLLGALFFGAAAGVWSEPIPPAPAPYAPASDPVPTGDVPQFVPAVSGKHPRLLFTAETLPKIREFYLSDAGAVWRKQLEDYLPSCRPPTDEKFLVDATDGQRQGLWKLPTVALHYVLTGDKTSYDRTVGFLQKFAALPHWDTSAETDSGMSAANILVGVALAYDWLYDDLDPALRERVRLKLIAQARAFYYGGHLLKNPAGSSHYWQNDPQNNHRWHNDAGVMLATLAADEGDLPWLRQQMVNDLALLAQWLPADGSDHEGPNYQVFGTGHLVMAMQASDECLGTKFLAAPYFQNVGPYLVHMALPGYGGTFGFGDWSGTGYGYYNNFLLKTAALSRQADVKDAVMRAYEKTPSSMAYAWMSIVWDDPTLPRGDAARLPPAAFFPDLGVASVRDGWKDDAVAALFKCGPLGGARLSAFRAWNKERTGNNYVNVGHDDPDANGFVLAMGGSFVAETDRYAEHKMSRAHNTILVNGWGQMAEGRAEDNYWNQPGTADLSQTAVVTAWRDTPGLAAVEGEAAGAYIAWRDPASGRSRPALDRFRRDFLFVKGDYVLVLDDIRAPAPVDVAWLVQGPDLKPVDAASRRFELVSGAQHCPFQLAASQDLECAVAPSPAEDRGAVLGFQQLQARATAPRLLVAALFQPWKGAALSVRLEAASPDAARIVVEGDGLRDVWTWKAAEGRFTAASLSAVREKGASAAFPFQMNPANAAPPH